MASDTPQSTRSLFATASEAQAAVIDVAASARRHVAIFSPTLEPTLYENMEFLSQIKQLILSRKYARVRVLLHDPTVAVRNGHRLVALSRQLTSFIQIRTAHEDYAEHTEDFIVADSSAFAFRTRASQWNGVTDLDGTPVARRYLDVFDEIWEKSVPEPEFRRLHL